MKISKKNFHSYILSYTEDELFYRRLYEEEHFHPETFREYVASLDKEYIKRRQLYVPLLHDVWFPYISEREFFQSHNQNVYVSKHYRYTPEFVHEHEYYELFYVYSGNCLNTIQEKQNLCTAGDICILPPKTKHSIGVFNDSVVINIMLKSGTFHATFFELFTDNNPLSHFFSHMLYEKTENNYLFFHTGNDSVIRSLIEDIYIEYYGHEKYSETLLDSYLLTFWSLLLRRHEHHLESFLNTTHKNLAIPDILNYLQANFTDVTLASAASHFGFSVPHFSKLIKDNTGQNFTRIIRDIRLNKACTALKTTDLSIASICQIIGYPSPEHFNRIFKKTYGMTPGEYRSKKNCPSFYF